jgi:hypothetical protein
VGVPGAPDNSLGHATDTFWRDVENLRVEGISAHGTSVSMFWFTSQACPVRQVVCDADIQLDSPSVANMWASGGFIGDTVCGGSLYSRTQQQFCFRNTSASQWQLLGGMNWLFADCSGPGLPAPTCDNRQNVVSRYTLRDKPTKPLLTDRGVRYNNSFVSFTDALIVSASTSLEEINSSSKSCIIFPSGKYAFPSPIRLTRASQIVMGVGWPLFQATSTQPIFVVANSGVVLAGLLLEVSEDVGGSVSSLLHVTSAGSSSALFDIFCRMLTPQTGTASCDCMVKVDQDACYLENLWLWVADHQGDGVPQNWERMRNPTGIEVTGADVTALCLAVEHQSGTGVNWSGVRGACYFFQSEFPYYDVPAQSAFYTSTDPSHKLVAAGSYAVLPTNASPNLTAVAVQSARNLDTVRAVNWGGVTSLKYAALYTQDQTRVPQPPLSNGGSFTVCQ